MPIATEFHAQEVMAAVLARDLQDGEIGRVGISGGVPIAACLLAQALHAPNLTVIAPAGVNPRPHSLAWAPSDYRYCVGAESMDSFYELYSQSERGFDYMFHTGVQIDRWGNFNLHGVQDAEGSIVFHGPGLANDSFTVTARRYYLYTFSHRPRTFVPAVDFVSGRGIGPRQAGREGPRLVVTPLCVMDFDPEGGMRLRSRHPGVSTAEIAAATGFPLVMPGTVPVTEPPTQVELAVLRALDQEGVLRM